MGVFQNKKKRNSKGLKINTAKKRQKGDDEKARKIARSALITVLVVGVLFIGALFINSNYVRQNMAAVKLGGVKYSLTDFNYYYQNLYAQYYSSMSGAGSDFTSAMLPQRGESLKTQIYDEETGETWADFFREMTIEQLKEDNKILVEAIGADYQLTDEDKAAMEDEVETMRSTGYSYSYKSLDDYLKALYGKGMTEKAFRKVLEQSYLVSSYTNYINDSFTYTADQLEQYYTENKDKLDTYTYRYFNVAADVNKADYDTDDAYNAAKEAAVDKTEEQAKAYAATITDEASFITAAREYDPEAYADDNASRRVYQGELLGSNYGDWLRDPARKEGDLTTVRFTNGTYVVYFIGRDDNHYNTVDIRTIICVPETVNPDDYADDETTDAYDAAVEAADQAAEKTANDIMTSLDDQGGTEEAFISQTDFYNGTIQIDSNNSGLKEQVYKAQMPEEITAWIFDAARKDGDYAMIPTSSGNYYVVYFVSTDDLYSDVVADNKMRNNDLQAWKDSLTIYEPKTTWIMTLM